MMGITVDQDLSVQIARADSNVLSFGGHWDPESAAWFGSLCHATW